jgi:hypothetical protein
MFAFFGLGTQEIIVLGLLVAGIAGIVGVILYLNRPPSAPSDRLAELEEENRRLRAKLDGQNDRPA